MTTARLYVSPIDKAAPGSHREIRTLLRAFAAFQEMNRHPDQAGEAMRAYDRLEELLLPHLTTDEGFDVREVFADVSEERFGELVTALMGGEGVPEAKSSS